MTVDAAIVATSNSFFPTFFRVPFAIMADSREDSKREFFVIFGVSCLRLRCRFLYKSFMALSRCSVFSFVPLTHCSAVRMDLYSSGAFSEINGNQNFLVDGTSSSVLLGLN